MEINPNIVLAFYLFGLCGLFLLGFLVSIVITAIRAKFRGEPVYPAIEPLLDEW